MAKKLAAILLCVVLIFVGVLALGHLTRPLGDDVAIANVENFHKLPENSIDVIVYGSSHAWRNVNADEMYDKYGIGAYNYAANWQHLDTTWLFVHDSLATQTPKVALIEGMHINSNEFDTDMDGEIYYTTPIPESKYKRAYLKMCFENHIWTSGFWIWHSAPCPPPRTSAAGCWLRTVRPCFISPATCCGSIRTIQNISTGCICTPYSTAYSVISG